MSELTREIFEEEAERDRAQRPREIETRGREIETSGDALLWRDDAALVGADDFVQLREALAERLLGAEALRLRARGRA